MANRGSLSMRAILMIGCAALTLSACGDATRDTEAANDMNALTADNMMMDQNAAMTGPGGMDGNLDTNAATENMMMNDMTTNETDTNLDNGL